MFNILVIDDEKEITELVEIYLTNNGYKVYKCFNGNDGLLLLEKEKIDLIILDIMMTGIDGYDTCMKIRKNYCIPIIMISAKSLTMDKIKGLSLGADDYLTKPFEPMELIARVQAQLRRFTYFNTLKTSEIKQEENNNLINLDSIKIYTDNHKVLKYDKEIKLTPTEYKILTLLAENKGKVYSAEDIYKSIWEEKYFEGNNTVMAHMWRLREKIEDDPKDPVIIQTVWGVGYKIDE